MLIEFQLYEHAFQPEVGFGHLKIVTDSVGRAPLPAFLPGLAQLFFNS
jgi:hypothetical protein